MLVITDGQSNNPTDTIAAANLAISKGIRTFAVGVGNYNDAELLAIAGGIRDHVKTKRDFNDLMLLLRPVTTEMCLYG